MSGWFMLPAATASEFIKVLSYQSVALPKLYYVNCIALEAFEKFRDRRSDEFNPSAPSSRIMPKSE
jgi:hypothetical protein